MGSKGPLIIFFLGVGGFVILGLMANWLLENNPVLQKQNVYRESLLEEFPVQRVKLSRQGGDYELELWVDRSEVAVGAGARGSGLPSSLAPIRRHFEREFKTQTPPQNLEVIVRPAATGISCFRDDTVLFSQAYALEEEREACKRALQRLLGAQSIVLREDTRGGVIVQVRGKPDARRIEQAARRLASYKGGGWRAIEIRVGRNRHRFDGAGKKLP